MINLSYVALALEVMLDAKPIAKQLSAKLTEEPWHNSLLLTAVDTDQMRYAEQVTRKVSGEVRDALARRLATQLPRDCEAQVPMELSGLAFAPSATTPITFVGVADAVHDGQVFELKFVSELDHAMFLQLALYLVMVGHQTGVLWNTHRRALVSAPRTSPPIGQGLRWNLRPPADQG